MTTVKPLSGELEHHSWGLLVQGRPPTPSEGRAQQYTRFGPKDYQALITYNNGTCLEFGPQDLVDEFDPQKGHPFFNQNALVDTTIRDIQSIRMQHNDRILNNLEDPFLGFRTMPFPGQPQVHRYPNGDVHEQVPSYYARVGNTLSMYSTLNKADTPGGAHPGMSTDTRFGVLEPSQLAARRAQNQPSQRGQRRQERAIAHFQQTGQGSAENNRRARRDVQFRGGRGNGRHSNQPHQNNMPNYQPQFGHGGHAPPHHNMNHHHQHQNHHHVHAPVIGPPHFLNAQYPGFNPFPYMPGPPNFDELAGGFHHAPLEVHGPVPRYANPAFQQILQAGYPGNSAPATMMYSPGTYPVQLPANGFPENAGKTVTDPPTPIAPTATTETTETAQKEVTPQAPVAELAASNVNVHPPTPLPVGHSPMRTTTEEGSPIMLSQRTPIGAAESLRRTQMPRNYSSPSALMRMASTPALSNAAAGFIIAPPRSSPTTLELPTSPNAVNEAGQTSSPGSVVSLAMVSTTNAELPGLDTGLRAVARSYAGYVIGGGSEAPDVVLRAPSADMARRRRWFERTETSRATSPGVYPRVSQKSWSVDGGDGDEEKEAL